VFDFFKRKLNTRYAGVDYARIRNSWFTIHSNSWKFFVR